MRSTIIKSFLLSVFVLFLSNQLWANDTPDVNRNDSLTLAQAYVNLTLTEKYFDTLSIERLSKILPFEEDELRSIKDSNFIQLNGYLYNFSYSLLYFNKAKLLFKTNTSPDRETLLKWKYTLEEAIKYFNLANLNEYPFNKPNSYNEFIEFSGLPVLNLKKDILELKAQFTIYFNRNIYPDFQRIFYEAKKTGHFNFDSLAYYTSLFNLPLSRNILNNTDDGITLNRSQDKGFSNINTGYNLELALDLISRYLQLNYLAKDISLPDSAANNTCTIYVQYKYFIKDININDSTGFLNASSIGHIGKDSFFLKELNPDVCRLLYNDLEKKSLSGLITVINAYQNLSHIEKNFDSLSIEQIEKVLLFNEKALSNINDSAHIAYYFYLYQQAFSLLYYEEAKLLLANNANPSRGILLQCKNKLEKSIDHFNKSELDSVFPPGNDRKLFIDLIGFNGNDCKSFQGNIINLKATLTPYFNRDIYPDFQRIFYAEKKSGRFSFDSLQHYTLLYNLPLSRDILDGGYSGRTVNYHDDLYTWTINKKYKLDLALDLISRYLQLRYILKTGNSDTKNCSNTRSCYQGFMSDLKPANKLSFGSSDSNQIVKDDFFRKELGAAACDKLLKQLIKKCGLPSPSGITDTDADGVADILDKEVATPIGYQLSNRYYFPIPAPFPSAYLAISNYKPGLKTMKQVDDYFKNLFNRKGYSGHLHYYYVQSGFAVITSLEKINKNGVPVSGSQRWNVSIGGNGSLSLYETFKSIFFETESDFRIIGLVIAPTAATVQSSAASIGTMQDLLQYSYSSLPEDLQNFSLPKKTLTVLIYDFHQSDVGKVPVLDVSKRLSARTHLERSGLGELLNSR